MELNRVVIGDKITDGIYVLKSIRNAGNGKYDVILKDKSGELNCELANERFDESFLKLKGGAVKVTFIVTNGLNTKPLGVIKQMAIASSDEYSPSDLFDGLSDEKIAEYTRVIKECTRKIPDVTLQKLCNTILSDDVLKALSTMPASLSHHCRYRGGALAATAVVTKMVMQTGLQYLKGDNGLYKPSLDWSTLLASSLLHCVGVVDYYTPETPFSKTPVGVERGYQSVLQHHIESACFKSGIEVSESLLARILNILGSSVPMKSGIRATSSEGIILRKCLELYEELDMIDADIAGHDPEDGETYFYSKKSHRNIAIEERKVA